MARIQQMNPPTVALKYRLFDKSKSKSGKPMKLQKACRRAGVKKDPVLR